MQAFGSLYKGKHVGVWNIATWFLEYSNYCSEGGMVVTNDETLYDRAVHYKVRVLQNIDNTGMMLLDIITG